jgi:hypothetical protein
VLHFAKHEIAGKGLFILRNNEMKFHWKPKVKLVLGKELLSFIGNIIS